MPLFDAPPAEIVAPGTNNSDDDPNEEEEEERKTHIEVCIRIRPLLEGKKQESSNSFLLRGSNNTSNTSSSSARKSKPQIPRLGLFRQSSSSSRGGCLAASDELAHQQQNSQCQQQQYAWKAHEADATTVRQTTDLVQGRTHQYTLDRIHGPQATTRDLYDASVQDLVHAAMDGYHTSVLAYGQTSTGKTHTITGTPAQPGILPLAVQECFEYLHNVKNSREYLIRVSYLEVYKENIRDLLAPTTPGSTPTPIRLFESTEHGLVIKGLREQVVTNPQEVFNLLRQGESRRQVGATSLNLHSSRSHTIVRIWIESRAIVQSTAATTNADSTTTTSTGTAPTAPVSSTSSLSSSVTGQTSTAGGTGAVRISSLSIVDLAGSESVRLSKNAHRAKEGHYINQSLMALGKVVYALSESASAQSTMSKLMSRGQQAHIPYRDSKLTRLLQPSLSGKAQVVLICCISPLQDHVEESHNTFKFAVRAKKIPQIATMEEVSDDADKASATLLQSYREEIEDLRQQLKEARADQQQSQQQSLSSPEAAETEDEVHELVHAIQAMERLILKSKPNGGSGSTGSATVATPARTIDATPRRRPEDLLDEAVEDYDQEEGNLMALANDTPAAASRSTSTRPSSMVTPMRRSGIPAPLKENTRATTTSSSSTDAHLSTELARIQGLLGSVLKKRKAQNNVSLQTTTNNPQQNQAEVRELKAQLEQQEISTSLRKADSSFLQKQLQEKDDLLSEVSTVLEQLETRQIQLENENASLRQQLAAAVAAAGVTAPPPPDAAAAASIEAEAAAAPVVVDDGRTTPVRMLSKSQVEF